MKSDNTTPHMASQYNMQIQKTIPYYDTFHEQTIDLIEMYKSRPLKWLDIGSGTGTFVQKAAQHFRQTQFYLLDPSKQMMEKAQSQLMGQEKCTFLPCCSSQNMLSYITEPMDVITAIQVHHYLQPEERKEATKNVYHLLNKEGIYITFENVRPLTSVGIQIALDRWGMFQEESGRSHEDVVAHKKRLDQNYFPITVLEHLKVLEEAGFSVMEPFWLSYMQVGFYAIK